MAGHHINSPSSSLGDESQPAGPVPSRFQRDCIEYYGLVRAVHSGVYSAPGRIDEELTKKRYKDANYPGIDNLNSLFEVLHRLCGDGPDVCGIDFGCGSHWFVDRARTVYGWSAVGYDPDPNAIEKAKQRFPQSADGYLCRDPMRDGLPEADSSQSFVVSNAVIQHFDDDELARAFREIARVLRPGGYFQVIFKRWTPEFSQGAVHLDGALRIVDEATGESQFQDPTMKEAISKLPSEELDNFPVDRREGWRTYRLFRVEQVEELAARAGLQVADEVPLASGDLRRGVITYASGKGLPTACVIFTSRSDVTKRRSSTRSAAAEAVSECHPNNVFHDPADAKSESSSSRPIKGGRKMADSEDYDVFLSYNDNDRNGARGVADALRRRKLNVWFAPDELPPGSDWQLALDRISDKVKSVVVLIGGHGLGPWQREEVRGFLLKFAAKELPVIPVLLSSAPSEPELPLFLMNRIWEALDAEISEASLDRLEWGITGVKPPGLHTAATTASPPGGSAERPPDKDLTAAKAVTAIECVMDRPIDVFSIEEFKRVMEGATGFVPLMVRITQICAGSTVVRIEGDEGELGQIAAKLTNLAVLDALRETAGLVRVECYDQNGFARQITPAAISRTSLFSQLSVPLMCARIGSRDAAGRRTGGARQTAEGDWWAGGTNRELKLFYGGISDRLTNGACEESRLSLRALAEIRRAIWDIQKEFAASFRRGRIRVGADLLAEHKAEGRVDATIILDTMLLSVYRHYLNEKFGLLSDTGVSVPPEGTPFRWIVDPIDGARHFRRGLPLFASSAALCVDADAVSSMIYAPVTQELFFALADEEGGAYLNDWDTRLKVSDKKLNAGDAMLHVEFPNMSLQEKYPEDFEQMCKVFSTLMGTAFRIRGVGIGALGLAYVAKGAFEGYVTLPGTTQLTDVAAGILLVKQAGGAVAIQRDTGFPNGVRVIAANNEDTRKTLMDIIELPRNGKWDVV